MATTQIASVNVLCSGPGGFGLRSRTRINVIALTAGNFATQNSLMAAYKNVYDPMTNGNVQSWEVTVGSEYAVGYPSGTANRGQKWIVTSRSASGRIYTHTIPAGPGAAEVQSDNISADLTGATWVAYIAGFEAVAVDPFGSALTILSGKLAGRNK